MPVREFVLLTAATTVVMFLSIWFVDQPLAFFIHENLAALQPALNAITPVLEVAGGYTVSKWLPGFVELLIGAVLFFALKRRDWGRIFFFAGSTFLLTRLVAGMLKNVFLRIRPHELFETGGPGATFYMDGSSFPSGHTAHFWGLFLPFFLLFPRARPVLAIVPLYIAFDRIFETDHYLSDVLFSAYLALLFALVCARVFRVAMPYQATNEVRP